MPELRQMCMSDLPKVLKVIDAYDDGDAEAAEKDYQEIGFDNQYVLEANEKVMGVTGYREIVSCDRSYWLSWTYIDPTQRGQGIGKVSAKALLKKVEYLYKPQ